VADARIAVFVAGVVKLDMIDFLSLLAIASFDEPRRIIDMTGVQIFIESQRPKEAGPGKVVALTGGYFDDDAHPDRLVVYTYEHRSSSSNRNHGLYAVAFFTEEFETSDIVFIPEADIIPQSVHGYSSDGKELVIRGLRHLPGDDECCPSASASIALWVVDGEVVVLRSEYSRFSNGY
jgi:hypothetical protein